MAILAIDTSYGISAAIVSENGAVLASEQSPEQRHHAELLAPMIEKLLSQVNAEELTAVAVGRGPAPFTGLRAGMVAARAFSYATKLPLISVTSLTARAASFFRHQLAEPSSNSEAEIAADAKRKEFYHCRYQFLGFDEFDAAKLVLLTELDIVPQESSSHSNDVTELIDAVEIARLALAQRSAGIEEANEPLYLRNPDAQVPKQALAGQ